MPFVTVDDTRLYYRLDGSDELAHELAELPQGAMRSDKETMVRNVGRTYEEQLRQEAELAWSMFQRRDSMRDGAKAFRERLLASIALDNVTVNVEPTVVEVADEAKY